MIILAFETTAKSASVALLQDGILLAESYQNSGQTHSQTVMKMVEHMLENCQLTADDIDAVGCASGPGSFTGVRIGVAAAKGFCWGRQIPLFGISTLEAMAYSHCHMDAIIVPSMDARRSQVYTALFRTEKGILSRLTDDMAISIEELGNKLKKLEKQKILVGDGGQLCYNTLDNLHSELTLLPEHLRMQRASGVALATVQAMKRGEIGDANALIPNYLRLSQAERERNERESLIQSTSREET